MPTPLEILTDPVTLTVFGIYLAFLAWEALAPARDLPHLRGWRLKGALAFLSFILLSSYLPMFLATLVGQPVLFDLSGLGTWGGAACAFVTYEALLYAWHRSMHESNWLFRTFHQMHHSAERIDVSGAFWFSPFDMMGFTLLSTLALTLVGVTPQAVVLFILGTSLLSVFQHANLRTPQWLGLIVQRPEAHARHHERGHHFGNFSDVPAFDMMFGTFENPKHFPEKAGFYDGASARLGEMLLCRDVTRKPPTRAHQSLFVGQQGRAQRAKSASILSRT